MKRPSLRQNDELRSISIETNIQKHATGSCLIKCGNTHVLCSASYDEFTPRFLKGTGSGWITAEYGMLPGSTHSRIRREAASGKQGGRTVEIQRLIGRSLRSCVDLKALGECQIIVDCDVVQADGGTRTASITGGFVALYLAFQKLQADGVIGAIPVKQFMAAVSCGLYEGSAVLDLDYAEDSNAQADTNFVLSENGNIIEIQGTAEGEPFKPAAFQTMFDLAQKGISELITLQKQALNIE